MEWTFVLLTLAVVFGFYMAWSIGANDVANAMGTSVGSGALTLMGAVVLAGILEFAGAFLVGANVTDTVRGGVIDPTIFADSPIILVCGMLAALLAAGAWLQLASYFGWPVSTTHSIIGAIVGFGAVVGGPAAVYWFELGKVVSSWVVSPLLAGAISFIIFNLILRFIFYAASPVVAVRRAMPVMVFAVFFVMTLVTVWKGLGNVEQLKNLSGMQSAGMATLIGLITAAGSFWLVKRTSNKVTEARSMLANVQYRQRVLEKAARHLRRAELASDKQMAAKVHQMVERVNQLAEQNRAAGPDGSHLSQDYREVERVFIYLQILSAGFVAFAHGSNDVANAIGPLSVIVQTVQTGTVEVVAGNPVPSWALLLGGLGIVVGLATWGWRVIQTIGKRITELTPSRGFAAEYAAASTIVLASVLGLPISTTHTLVGAVLGVGLARGIGALNLNTVRDIIASWIITIPAGAGMAILFYYILISIFG